MKTGRSLQDIAAELERQQESRRDYIAPQGAITAVVDRSTDTPDIRLDGFNGHSVGVQAHAHRQLADHLGIPAKYYDRMRAEQPDLLANNLNTWLHADGNDKRMIRTLDGNARAFLSPKYRPLDNFALASAVLPKLQELNVQVMSAELTETRMYIKGILPDLSEPLPAGMQWGGHNILPTGSQMFGRDGHLVAAIVISNSEVGAGTLRVEPSVFTTFCTNLAIIKAAAMKKYHVGRAFEADGNWEVFRDATREADDRAFFMKVSDVTAAAFNIETFRAAVAQIGDAAKTPIESSDMPAVVEMAVRQLALPVGTTNSILTHLARGGDLTKWGLSSAVTSAANTFETYEGATELERAGGEILALDGKAWEVISRAA